MCAPLFLGLGVWGGEEGDDGAPLPWSRCLLNQIWGVVDLGFWGSSLMAWRRSRGGGRTGGATFTTAGQSGGR
jgi:hypothetical protein